MKTIGEKIKDLRRQHKLSALQLGTKLGKEGSGTAQSVYDMESGKIKRIDLETLTKLSEIFDVPITYFSKKGSNDLNGMVINSGNRTSESAEYWKGKYYDEVLENSKLKSRIIGLLEKLNS